MENSSAEPWINCAATLPSKLLVLGETCSCEMGVKNVTWLRFLSQTQRGQFSVSYSLFALYKITRTLPHEFKALGARVTGVTLKEFFRGYFLRTCILQQAKWRITHYPLCVLSNLIMSVFIFIPQFWSFDLLQEIKTLFRLTQKSIKILLKTHFRNQLQL